MADNRHSSRRLADLPLEVLEEVARHLVAPPVDAYQSLQDLVCFNRACKATYAASLAALWRNVTVDYDFDWTVVREDIMPRIS